MDGSLDIMLKLFDTLKESADKNTQAINGLISQQNELINHVKYLPIQELRDTLKDHSTKSGTDINVCTETVQTKSGDILQKVKDIDGKINKMLIVIGVVFSLLAVAYFIARSTTDVDQIKKEVALDEQKLRKQITEDIESRQKKEHQEIIDAVKKAINQYHEDNKKTE
jgi:beta-lactamase regulating signal transducer with metallopeptidase domain